MSIDIKVGDKVVDNDPRMYRGLYTIESILFIRNQHYCTLSCGSKTQVRIAASRIYTDGKPRRSGWSVVK